MSVKAPFCIRWWCWYCVQQIYKGQDVWKHVTKFVIYGLPSFLVRMLKSEIRNMIKRCINLKTSHSFMSKVKIWNKSVLSVMKFENLKSINYHDYINLILCIKILLLCFLFEDWTMPSFEIFWGILFL
jgi:hypothetical protein